jgi:hypothetical protein
MSLTGQGVRIIVSEPWEWKHGNLFGTVVSQRGQVLLVRLSKAIEGNSFTSDLMELRPRYQGETFKRLEQFYSVTVGGALVHSETKETDYVMIGSVTMD